MVEAFNDLFGLEVGRDVFAGVAADREWPSDMRHAVEAALVVGVHLGQNADVKTLGLLKGPGSSSKASECSYHLENAAALHRQRILPATTHG